MRSALIGFTGFVGSNLSNSHSFDGLYNSKNIDEIAGKEYDVVVSAANRADSFRINTDGAADLAEIDTLIDIVLQARIRKLVLISTVCVYPEGGSPDESAPLSAAGLTPYGANRLHQERRFGEALDTTIIRLPQLYGANLKKGVVYDLANDYRVEHIRPGNEFQHYDVRDLWDHISLALENDLDAVNIATPPISNELLAREVFGRDISGQVPPEPESPFARMYTRNMTTRHSELFGGEAGYLLSEEAELESLRRFTSSLKQKRD
ncbi:NAD-dependent epimerase/dehydratase family protein [Microbacterium sp. NPDC087868]|uniref:NAD-dependent epimerase/dehydratase family protein n=1 Tax=Microbacterium sp. NPDC087868 TaxID=3364195 RepID=UPI00384C7A79